MAKVGDAATREIAKGLASILSIPANELGNYIADKIRFLRFKSLLKVLKKAERLCDQEGTKLKTPAIKFLVPFAEAASLEEEGDDDIQMLLAELLKSSGDLDIGDSLMFISFLKRIGRREIEFLKELLECGRATTRAMLISVYNAADAEMFGQNQIETLLERLPDDFNFSLLADLLVDVAECTGILFTEIALIGANEHDEITEISADIDWETRNRRSKPAAALETLGIVERLGLGPIPVPQLGPEAELFVKGYRVTPAGIAFYEACTGSPFKHKFERDVDDNQTEGFRSWMLTYAARGDQATPR